MAAQAYDRRAGPWLGVGDAAGHVWALEDEVARSYTIESDKVRLGAELKLAAGAGALLAPLSDGSVVWADNVALHHVAQQGKSEWYPEPVAGVIVQVAAGPPGQVWVAQASGVITLVKIAAKLEPVRTIRGDRVLSLVATPTHIATVVGNTPRLVVRDAAGTQVLERPVPPSVRALSVALSPFAPLVAVGGYGEFVVWNLDGKLLGQQP